MDGWKYQLLISKRQLQFINCTFLMFSMFPNKREIPSNIGMDDDVNKYINKLMNTLLTSFNIQ